MLIGMLLVPVELLRLLAMDHEGMDLLVLLSVLLGKLQGLGLYQHHVHLYLDLPYNSMGKLLDQGQPFI